LKGHITVQYWLWNVRKEYQSQDNNGSIAAGNNLFLLKPFRSELYFDFDFQS
jgi:hypothetical protein